MKSNLKNWINWLKTSGVTQTVIGFVSFLIIASVTMLFLESYEEASGIKDLFNSLWFSIVTVTTVGYGDVYPVTGMGKLLSGIIALIGVGIVALPTGIISSAFIEKIHQDQKTCICPNCGANFTPKE